MKRLGRRVLVIGIALGSACDNGNSPPLPQASSLRALHTIRGGPSLTWFVDGARGSTLNFGELSRPFFLSPGQHDLVIEAGDGTPSLILLFNTLEGVNYSGFAIDTMVSGSLTILPILIPDTGAVPAAGHARLRLANFGAAAPAVDAYRTEPGNATPLASAAPLNFRAVTRYFDGTPGSWSVVISHAGTTDTLVATGPLSLTDGQARTVVVLDSTAGHVTWRLVPDRN